MLVLTLFLDQTGLTKFYLVLVGLGKYCHFITKTASSSQRLRS